MGQCLRVDAEWADRFPKELALLDAHCATPKPAAVAAKRTRAAIVDAEHATPKERHAAREALRNHKPGLARVEEQRIVWFDHGFVGSRLQAEAVPVRMP